MNLDDYWGFVAPVAVWCTDHYSVIFASVLFGMQFTYTAMKIKRDWKRNKDDD